MASLLYALLLRLYPRRFRARHAEPMRRVFAARYQDARRHGRRPALRFLLSAVLDVCATAAAERAAAARDAFRVPPAMSHRARFEEETRPMLWHSVLQDVRFALRSFVRAPLFSGLAVLALALGIGANSAIFSVVNGVLLTPLPYRAPERLVMVWHDNTREGKRDYPMSPANFLDYRASATAVERVEAMFSFIVSGSLRTEGGTEQITMSWVTPGMFTLLGREAVLGRALLTSDRSGTVVLSDGFWTRRFGRDPSVIGRRLVIGGVPATVVGVMPADFDFPLKGMLGPTGFITTIAPDVFATLDPSDPNTRFAVNGQPQRGVHYLSVLARLKPGVEPAQAQDEAMRIMARLEAAHPDTNRGLRANVVPLHEQAVGKARPALLLLLAGVGLVLLMACVNVANLLLARSVSRGREFAIRTALGAGRRRLLQQALTESVLLAGLGGVLALVFVHWSTRTLIALAPPDIPRLAHTTPDTRVFLATLVLALLTGIAVGLVPAAAALRSNVQGMLQASGRGMSGGSLRHRLRAGLVVGEVGLAVVLTIGAGLLVRSFVTLLDVDPGFTPEKLLTLQITLPDRVSTPDARRAMYRDLFARLESLPDVVATGGTTRLPLGSTNVTTRVAVEGRVTAAAEMPEVEFRRAVHNYFTAMGIPLLRGRLFKDDDRADGTPVVIVNDTMARRLWPGEDPVGKRVKMGSDAATPWSMVIGVVGDVRHAALDEPPAPEMYTFYLQGPPVSPFLVVRTTGDPAAIARSVQAELKALDKDLTVYDVRTMTDVRSASVAQRRFVVLLAAAFGVLALVLAAVGVYGVMALVVSERTQEMGIRLALGADVARVRRLVIGQGLAFAATGVVLGVAAALSLTPLMASQLYGVDVTDPVTLGGVPLLLLLVAAVACAVPAQRATRVDPVSALRGD